MPKYGWLAFLRDVHDHDVEYVDVDLLETKHKLLILILLIPHNVNVTISNIQFIFPSS